MVGGPLKPQTLNPKHDTLNPNPSSILYEEQWICRMSLSEQTVRMCLAVSLYLKLRGPRGFRV